MNNQTHPDEQAFIEVRGLSFNRGDRIIYDNVDLKIRRGQITAIMGPSGTGKTTLLRLIGGQLSPDHGQVKPPPALSPPTISWAGLTPNSAAWSRSQQRAAWQSSNAAG